MSDDVATLARAKSEQADRAYPPRRVPMSEERRQVFLQTLRATGSMAAAARAASPHCQGAGHGLTTFKHLLRADASFAAAVEDARDSALADVELEIHRRALQPPRRPVWEGGKVVGWIEDRTSSDRLLLRLASKLDPAWSERTNVDANVTVQGVLLSIAPEDVLLLAGNEQDALLELLSKIADAKGENGDAVPRISGARTPGTLPGSDGV